MPKSKDILKELDKVQEKNTLMQKYYKSNDLFSDLVLYKKNYESYMDKEVEMKSLLPFFTKYSVYFQFHTQ